MIERAGCDTLDLYVHLSGGLLYTRANVAPPFRPSHDGRDVTLREPFVESGVERLGSLADAGVACLPATWSAYRGAARADAITMIEQAAASGIRVAVWVDGDHEVRLPWTNVIQFQHAFARSRERVTAARVVPTIFSDVIDSIYYGVHAPLPKGDRPTIGFCGQATPRFADESKRLLTKGRSRIRWAIDHSGAIPEPWRSHIRLRARVLAILDADPRLDTNFIRRTRYRDGLADPDTQGSALEASSRAFFDNIYDHQYTVCVRGGGNFSVRLYETLCLGRVPLVVDDDGMLPWPDHQFWRDNALVVPVNNIARLGDLVVEHHAAADEAEWTARQDEARRLWTGWLSRAGYLTHLRSVLQP